MAMSPQKSADRLRVNMIECDGHGLCAELVPELIGLDEWGYPVISPDPVPRQLTRHAKRAVTLCPMLALKLERAGRT
jgi:ferredoxin